MSAHQTKGADAAQPLPGSWVDNHCHLDVGEGLSAVLDSAAAAGVVAMICVGTDVESSAAYVEMAGSHSQLWATAGVHPHESHRGIDGLRELVARNHGQATKLVAIGECGLDYHYDHSPRQKQREVFAEQIAIANEMDLPLVIHTRSAWDDTFAILDSESVPRRTVFHCFTGGPVEAELCIERGGLLSISGIVTFPSADDVRAAVSATPIDRLMVETDSPYLTPVPHRGKRNEPSMVPLVGARVAELLDADVSEVASATTATASSFYGLGLK